MLIWYLIQFVAYGTVCATVANDGKQKFGEYYCTEDAEQAAQMLNQCFQDLNSMDSQNPSYCVELCYFNIPLVYANKKDDLNCTVNVPAGPVQCAPTGTSENSEFKVNCTIVIIRVLSNSQLHSYNVNTIVDAALYESKNCGKFFQKFRRKTLCDEILNVEVANRFITKAKNHTFSLKKDWETISLDSFWTCQFIGIICGFIFVCLLGLAIFFVYGIKKVKYVPPNPDADGVMIQLNNLLVAPVSSFGNVEDTEDSS